MGFRSPEGPTMTIIVQRNRILAKGFREDKFEDFVNKNTVYVRKMPFGVEPLWVPMKEVNWCGEEYIAFPRNFPTRFLFANIEHDERDVHKNHEHHLPVRKVPIRMKKGVAPRSELQLRVADFLASRGEYTGLAEKPRRAVFVDTGEGKTFITIAEICRRGVMTAIICPDDRAIQTWNDEFIKFTDVAPEEVFVVSGADSLRKVLKRKSEVKVLLVSAPTLGSLFRNGREDEIVGFFEKMGVGLKVIDEMHLNLLTIFNLEMTVVTHSTFYLTATDSRRIHGEQKVLENMTPQDDCVFRQEKVRKFEFVRVKYYTNPAKEHQKGINTANGFSAHFYLKMLTNPELPYFDWYVEKVLHKTLKWALKNRTREEFKIAFLVKTKEAGNAIGAAIQSLFPELTVGYFNSDIADMETRFKETEKDIIVSTDKSFAGIINIKGLEIIINATPITSEPHLLQIMGRLRDEEGKRRVFVQLCDYSFKKARSMMNRMTPIVEPVMTDERTFVVGAPERVKYDEED